MTFSPDYVALCRELNLPREWRNGDWWTPCDGSLAAANQAYLYPLVRPGEDMGATFPESAAWLPLEGDWLDLLEAEGKLDILIHSQTASRNFIVSPFREYPNAVGSDRLTALGRLYASVQGRVEVTEK